MKLQGVIAKIINQKKDIKGLFMLQLDNESAMIVNKGMITCSFYFSRLFLYMPVIIKGEIIDDIFYVESFVPYFSRKDQVIRFLESRAKGTHIGKKRIEILVDTLKNQLFTIKRKDFKDVLKEIPGLSTDSVELFLNKWIYKTPLYYLEKYLEKYDINYSTILKINEEYKAYEEYYNDATKYIKTDPYRECIKFEIKRQIAESIAYDLNISAFDSRRIKGIINYILIEKENKGDTYITAQELVKKINVLSSKRPYKAKIPVCIIANEVTYNKNLFFDKENKTIAFKRTHDEEMNSAIRLNVINKAVKDCFNIQNDEIFSIEKALNISFAKEQREAFKILRGDGVSVLTGGPGTGKTTIINGIIYYYKKKLPQNIIRLAAPTGRAAKRLSEATHENAMTIHKMLEFNPMQEEGPERNNNNPLDADLIVIDEVSMCDIHLFNKLLDAIKDGCRLILVGDENQLPSVNAGNCLHDIIKSELFSVYRLKENFRNEGSIINNATKILNGEIPSPYHDFEIKKVDSDKEAFTVLSNLSNEYYDKNDLFKCQIIEASNKGSAGCYAINKKIHETLYKDDADSRFCIGDKVMFLQNNYSLDYVNGETAIIKYLDEKEIVIYDGIKTRRLDKNALNDATLCYSYTIHKSQGSENDTIIIYLSGENNIKRMMNRNLLYTAITRAKKKVVLVFSKDALKSCINNEYFEERKTRLFDYLVS